MRCKVVGIKRFSGVVDGKTINSAKLFVEVKLDSSRNSQDQFAAGYAVEELRLPSVELVRSLEHLPLPFMAEIETERVSNGRDAREVVMGVQPIQTEPAKLTKAA